MKKSRISLATAAALALVASSTAFAATATTTTTATKATAPEMQQVATPANTKAKIIAVVAVKSAPAHYSLLAASLHLRELHPEGITKM